MKHFWSLLLPLSLALPAFAAPEEVIVGTKLKEVKSVNPAWQEDGPNEVHYCYLYTGGEISGLNVPRDASPIVDFLVKKAESHTAAKPVFRIVLGHHEFAKKKYVTHEQIVEFPASIVEDYYVYSGSPLWRYKTQYVNFYANALYHAFSADETKAMKYTLIFLPTFSTGYSVPASLLPTEYGFLKDEGRAGFDCVPVRSVKVPEWTKKYTK